MSTCNNAMSRHNGLTTSSMFFPNSPGSPHNNGFPQTPSFVLNREAAQISSSEGLPLPKEINGRTTGHHSRTSFKQKSCLFMGKLDTMARHINFPNEDVPLIKHNSSQKAPFSRGGAWNRDDNPFNSQIVSSKPFHKDGNMEGNKKIGNASEPEPRRRRESVDLDAIARKGGAALEKFKFLQRSQPFQSIILNQSPLQKNDGESTNSDSGNQLLKPKQFDFSKKKLENKDEIGPSSQSIRLFQPIKKAQHIWPLSISPIEQKMPKFFQQQKGYPQPSSAGRAQSHQTHPIQQGHSPLSAIEFKKKKLFEGRPVSQVQAPQTLVRPQQQPRFNPMKLPNNEIKGYDREEPLSAKSKAPIKPHRQITIEDFQIINKLGKGAFGQVFMAEQKILGLICVIKKMSKKRIREAKVQEHIIRQIKLQSYFNHAHLTSLYGYFHDEEYLYLILECLPDGSLQQVKKKKKMPEKETADMVRQVAIGLQYMHQEYVIHRDLKPENLFLNQGYVKIGDFGCSIYHHQTGLRNTIVGCLEYSSPEQLSQEGYTDKIDSWCLGIMTYELLFGKSPFENDIKKMVMNGEGKTDLSEVVFPSTPIVSEDAQKFIVNLLNHDPEARMDMDEVLQHPFLKQSQKITT